MNKYYGKIILLSLILLITIFFSYAKDINIKDLKCDYNHERINNVTCKVKPLNGKNHVMDLSATLLNEVKEIMVTIEIFSGATPTTTPLVNVTQDFCKFMASKSSHLYKTLIENMFHDISNINHPCPYTGYIYVDGINPDSGMLPDAIPIGDFFLKLIFFEDKPENYLGSIDLAVAIVES